MAKKFICSQCGQTFEAASMPDKCPICGTNPTITELIDYEQAACDLKSH